MNNENERRVAIEEARKGIIKKLQPVLKSIQAVYDELKQQEDDFDDIHERVGARPSQLTIKSRAYSIPY